MENQQVVYKLTNIITNEIYIGKSMNFKRRMKEYERLNCKTQYKLYDSINKYGWYNFKQEIITKANKNFIINVEDFYISFYNSYYKKNILGLNMIEHPTTPGLGRKHTNKTKLKLSKLSKGRKLSDETKEKMSKGSKETAKYGKDHYRSKTIHQYNTEGNFIKTFYGISEASRKLNCSVSALICAVEVKCKCKGFYWSYEKLDLFKIPDKKRKSDSFIGNKFNMLKILSFKEIRNTMTYYLCVCDCGVFKILPISEIKRSKIKSCGCLRNKKL